MTTVLLIRHGRSTANTAGVLAGRSPGVNLDERGETQAVELAARLMPVHLDAVVSSPLERTRQTAERLVAGRAETLFEVDERFTECDYGTWSGRTLKSLAALSARAVSAIRAWNAKLGEQAAYAVVSHGDVIKAIAADALGLHLDLFQRIQVDPCSLTVVRYHGTRPNVLRINDTGGDVSALIRKPEPAPEEAGRAGEAGDAPVGGGAGA